MGALTPITQHFLDTRNGAVISYTRVKLLSTSDTITLPQFSNTTASASVAQVREAGDAAATVTSVVATGVVTIVGTVGQFCTVVAVHPHINFSST